MKKVLLYIWQLPQNILGLLLMACYKPERMHAMGNDVIKCSFFYDGVEHIYSWKYNSMSSSGGALKEYSEIAYQPIEQA